MLWDQCRHVYPTYMYKSAVIGVCRIWKQLNAVVRANMIEVRHRHDPEHGTFSTFPSILVLGLSCHVRLFEVSFRDYFFSVVYLFTSLLFFVTRASL